MFLELSKQSITRLLGITQQHGCVLVEEDRIINSSITHSQGALHHHHLRILKKPLLIEYIMFN